MVGTPSLAALLLPWALEVAGVLPPSYGFDEGVMAVLPRSLALPATPTLTVLLLSGVATIPTMLVIVGRLRDDLDAAERRVLIQAWNLRRLLPSEARSGG